MKIQPGFAKLINMKNLRKKLFFALILVGCVLTGCGEVCIMGQGTCPGFKSETQFTVSPSSASHLLQASETSVAFTLAGGAANYDIQVSYGVNKLVRLDGGSFENDLSVSAPDYTTSSFNLFFNTTTEITDTFSSSNNQVTITVTDSNGNTTSATVTVSK